MRDANGQQIAHVYYECEPGRRSAAKAQSYEFTEPLTDYFDETKWQADIAEGLTRDMLRGDLALVVQPSILAHANRYSSSMIP